MDGHRYRNGSSAVGRQNGNFWKKVWVQLEHRWAQDGIEGTKMGIKEGTMGWIVRRFVRKVAGSKKGCCDGGSAADDGRGGTRRR